MKAARAALRIGAGTHRRSRQPAAPRSPSLEWNPICLRTRRSPAGAARREIDVESNETAWIDRLGRRESHELSANNTARAEAPERCGHVLRRAQPPTGQQLGFRES